MKRFDPYKFVLGCIVVLLACSCGISYKAARTSNINPMLPTKKAPKIARFAQDTSFADNFTVWERDDSTTLFLLDRVVDEQTGEEMASVNMEAITVVASSKTVVERLGEITIDFNVSIPRSMQDTRWCLNFIPVAFDNFGVEQRLEPVVIKGELFSDVERRHVWQMDTYLNKLLGEQGESATNTVLLAKYYEALNAQPTEARKRKVRKTFEETIRFPLKTEVRLDSVIRHKSDITYYYRQTVKPTSGMRRLHLHFDSTIEAVNGITYQLPPSDTLTYYISSMISLIDTTMVYRKEVISKYLVVNDRNQLGCRVNVVFPQGKTHIIDTLRDNRQQIANIRSLMDSLVNHNEFIVDSIVLTAASSPEGAYKLNTSLAERRANALKEYIIANFQRSPEENIIFEAVGLPDSLNPAPSAPAAVAKVDTTEEEPIDLRKVLVVRWIGEDWAEFEWQLNEDSVMRNDPAKDKIIELARSIKNPDAREAQIRAKYPTQYRYILKNIYPNMRAVNFKYDLRRRGMVQDTLVTDVPDTTYLRGVEYLRQRDYKKALEILVDYETPNTALVDMSLGYNHNAYDILRKCRNRSAHSEYLMAICCSRLGKLREGVACYNRAVALDEKLMFRAGLDPEIQDLLSEAQARGMEVTLPEYW